MNMSILKKSNKPPEVGDVFIYQIKSMEKKYFFGRVVRTDASIGGFENTILVYLYKVTSNDKSVIPLLACQDLLVPPLATNLLPWKKGYFETIANFPLEKGDVLTAHCFKDFRGKFFDADSRPMSGPIEPVGDYGLHSYQTIDEAIGEALELSKDD